VSWIHPVPNLLTGLRILLALALPFLPRAWWLPVVVAAGLSDLVDGVIARRFHAVTPLGALLDGIADKLFTLAAVATFVAHGVTEWWAVLAVMARDLAVGLMAAFEALRGRWASFSLMKARLAGKATTALVFPWLASLLVPSMAAWRLPLWALAATASTAAAADYVVQYRRLHRHHREGTLPALAAPGRPTAGSPGARAP
jgi:phosphatidylglycerophosphate synthase